MQDQKFEAFRDNMDAWVKQIRREFSEFEDLPRMTEENTENIQHNYELICELKDHIEELKQELGAMKMIQIISMKNKEGESLKRLT